MLGRRETGMAATQQVRVEGAEPKGSGMIERDERKSYWRHTKWQMLTSLVPYLAVMIVLPLYADKLNSNRFLGFPLGYFFCGHGLMLIAIFTVASFVNRQDAIDHWHGGNEDI
jgi:putative solute:sodium symporter small subunit